ncbi:MAG: hypothetical protein DA328_06870 [Nitrososphaeraceae archaeon]|nr:hypothetical protein [Nitrososphaeraceae archaeon]
MANQNSVLINAASKFIIGLGTGVVADAIVEFFRVPVLEDKGLFGSPNMSNFETISYAVSLAGIGAGMVDVLSNKPVLGFSKDMIPLLAGYAIGVNQYESWIADKLGIRTINPYDTVQGFIPQLG